MGVGMHQKKRYILDFYRRISQLWVDFEKKTTAIFTPFQIRLWNILVFIARFLLLALPFHFLIWLNFDAHVLKEFTTKCVAMLLSFTSIIFSTEGVNIFIPQASWGIEIIKDCVGWKSALAFIGLIFAVRNIPMKHRIKGILWGVPIIYVGNVFRIFSSVYLSVVFGTEYFELIHDVLWQVGLIALVLAVWWVWLSTAKHHSTQV